MPLPFRSLMRFGRDSFLRSPSEHTVCSSFAIRAEGPKALSPEQWIQAARPEGPKALSPEQWIQAARPERAEALSPGQRPGLFGAVTCRPVRAKALKLLAIFKAFALTGRIADCHYTQGVALG